MASEKGPSEATGPPSSPSQASPPTSKPRNRSSTISSVASATGGRLMEADVPVGMWAASASQAAQAPTLADIRRGSLSRKGLDGVTEGQLYMSEEPGDDADQPTVPPPRRTSTGKKSIADIRSTRRSSHSSDQPRGPPSRYANGYIPPAKKPRREATLIALAAFWRWMLTPLGFLITLYGLNVVAWGGMLFLLLCNAAPAMCHPTCNDINSPRRIWIEIDSQILNALFCVTGFGLIPWRFRDLWFLMQYRLLKRTEGLRRLAGINRSWFRLPGSDRLDPETNEAPPGPDGFVNPDHENPAFPLPVSKIPPPPPTGERAPPTKVWKLDFVVWCNVWNTFLQACLCGFMWGMNRHNRPSWATGLFIALACGVAGCGGLMMYFEGKKVKKIEGVPVEKAQTIQDVESGTEMEHTNLRTG